MSAYQSVVVNGQPTEPVETDQLSRMADELKTLRQQNEDLSRQVGTAQGENSKAQFAVLQAEHQGVSAQEIAVSNYIAARQEAISGLTAQKAQLWGDGKFQEAAAVDTKLMEATAELTQAKRDLGQVQQQRAAIEARAAQPQQTPTDPTANMHPNVRDWIGRHPLFKTDAKFYSAAVAGDAVARHHGAAPGSDRYLQLVEEEIEHLTGRSAAAWHDRAAPEPTEERYEAQPSRSSQTEEDDVLPERAANPQPRAAGKGSMAAMAAGPSRAVAGNRNASGNRLPTLSPEQRDYALNAEEFKDYASDADRLQAYARNIQRAIADGRYGRDQ